VGALGEVARDFVEMKLHHGSVGVGQREGRPDAAGRADRAEQTRRSLMGQGRELFGCRRFRVPAFSTCSFGA
jgi:hypothetical protein